MAPASTSSRAELGRVGQVAVVRQRQRAAAEAHQHRLRVGQHARARRAVAGVADGGGALGALEHALGEDVGHQAHAAVRAGDAGLVHRDDAGRLLAAVLQRVQAQIREPRRVRMVRNADNAAHRSQLLRARCVPPTPSSRRGSASSYTRRSSATGRANSAAPARIPRSPSGPPTVPMARHGTPNPRATSRTAATRSGRQLATTTPWSSPNSGRRRREIADQRRHVHRGAEQPGRERRAFRQRHGQPALGNVVRGDQQPPLGARHQAIDQRPRRREVHAGRGAEHVVREEGKILRPAQRTRRPAQAHDRVAPRLERGRHARRHVRQHAHHADDRRRVAPRRSGSRCRTTRCRR